VTERTGTASNAFLDGLLVPMSAVPRASIVIPGLREGERSLNPGYLLKLREHLGAAVAFMKLSKDYFDFIDKMD
jgi:hypothetical protein